MDGGRDGTRTRDPELAPNFPVRRHTPATCAVRALSKLGFGRMLIGILYPPKFSRQTMSLHLECYNRNAENQLVYCGNIYVEATL
jgi:hypothetical protein